jgi:hypothetical protein
MGPICNEGGFETRPSGLAVLTSLFSGHILQGRKGGEGGMKLSKAALAKEAAFWGQVKKVDPRKVCHK